MQSEADPLPVDDIQTRFPVVILLEKQRRKHGQWSYTAWEVTGVVTGKEVADRKTGRVLVHSDDKTEQYLYAGYWLRLYKDAAHSYWDNLLGQKPSLFVICREAEDGELVPFMVTADHDEAAAHMEVDDTVFSVPIPPELYHWVERFVVAFHKPAEQRKRKRKNWVEDSHYGQAPERSGKPH